MQVTSTDLRCILFQMLQDVVNLEPAEGEAIDKHTGDFVFKKAAATDSIAANIINLEKLALQHEIWQWKMTNAALKNDNFQINKPKSLSFFSAD